MLKHPNFTTEVDGPWKYVLSLFFQPFMELCLPELAKQIDWSKKYETLDKELQKIAPSSQTSKRSADMLFQVCLINGEEKWILLHLEIQAQKQEVFSERMYTYNYLLYNKHKEAAVGIALFLDEDPLWRPNCFSIEDPFGGEPSLLFRYRIIKLLDYSSKKEFLEKQANLFSLVLLAQLEMMETKKNLTKRLQNKISLTRALHNKGLSKEEISQLFIFIDWIIKLPNDLMINYKEQAKEIAEQEDWDDWSPRYVSTFEQVARIEGLEAGLQEGRQKGLQEGREKGLDQGRQEGRQEGEATLLAKLLKRRFPRDVNEKHLSLLKKATSDTLSHWGENLIDATTIDEVFAF